MTRPVVIVGCGGFGREVFGIIQAQRADGAEWRVEGFLDDSPANRNLALVRSLGSQVLGPVALIADLGEINAVIAVGAPDARANISRILAPLPITWPVLVHPDATVGLHVTFDVGVVVAAGARLSTNIAAGKHVQIDQNATVGHDVVIGDFARLNPQACVSGSVSIGQCALIGAHATILQGLRVGSLALVAAGACVVGDVEERSTVKGIPAR